MEPVFAKWINEELVKQYGYTYDLEKAKKILDDAGIVDTDGDGIREMPDGTPLKGFTIRVPYGWTDWMMMCDMMAENMKQIGIEVTPEFPDFSIWWDQLQRGDYDMVMGWSAGPGFDHPWNVFRVVMDPRLQHPAGNWERYPNEGVIEYIDRIPKETDPDKLKSLYEALQETAMKDLPGIPLFWGAVWYEYSEDYWVGWPNEENGRWFADMWGIHPLVPFFYIAKKGETPTYPSWIDELKFSSSEIFAQLNKVIEETSPTTLAEKISKLTGRVDTIEGDIRSINSQLSKMSLTLESMSSTLDTLKKEMPSASEIEALKAQVATLSTIAYVSVVISIIAVAVAIFAFTRKK